jgi:predicted ATPase/class 3 adenylate cyclase/tetratricopeptide (TPR) repeat protein
LIRGVTADGPSTARGRTRTALPEGQVTFLFTDIEGSTRLFRRLGDDYVTLLTAHDEAVRDAIERRDGVVVKTEGDAFFAAFDSALDAVRAAIDAQRALVVVTSPDGQPVRVRMGLHTGLAYPRNNDYVALAVHQAARIAAAANGGQIVVSAATWAAIDAPIADVQLIELGSYRLKDFDDPTVLGCVTARGLDTAFPALRAIRAARGNLPTSTTEFVGRAADVARLYELLTDSRIVTVVGPGGCGKTRLALESARGLLDGGRFEEAWLIDLTQAPAGDDVAPYVAAVFGATDDSPIDAVVERLIERPALVLLDNCEHVISSASSFVREVYGATSSTFLLTSQLPVGVQGERLLRLEPLEATTALQLFVDRVRALRPEFALTAENADAARRICEALDHLPLALELAAARAAALSLDDIATRLTDRFRVLRSSTHPERHQTLSAVISWSHGLCSRQEQVLLRRLSMFAGSFTLGFAEKVTGVEPLDDLDVLDLLCSLVDRSLVQIDDLGGRPRYRLLESVRAFAVEELIKSGERREISTRALTRVVDGDATPGFLLVEASDDVDDDLSIIEGILLAGDVDQPVAIAASNRLATHYRARGMNRHGLGVLGRVLARFPDATAQRAKLLASTATLALELHDLDAAVTLLDEASAGDLHDGDLAAWIASRYALVATRRGDLASALDLMERALETAVTPEMSAVVTSNLAVVEIERGGYERAVELAATGSELFRQLGAPWQEAQSVGNLAELWARLGDDVKALRYEREALAQRAELGSIDGIGTSLVGIGRIAARRGLDNDAVVLLGGATRLLEESGTTLFPSDQALLEETLVELRERVGPDEFHDQWRSGSATAAEELIGRAKALRL